MPLFAIVGLLLMGWVSGSLINYVADTLPVSRRLSPIGCTACGQIFHLKNYLLMQSCRGCGKRRSVRAWVVQFVAVFVTMAHGFVPPERIGFWPGTLLLIYFGVVAVIDIEHRLILYVESAVGAVLGLGIGITLHGVVPTMFGGLAGLAIMAGLYILGWALARLMGKIRGQIIEEEALGFSDILLGGVLGLILGWPAITLGIFFTIFIAGAGSLVILLSQLLRRKYEPFAPVAFGPYMLLAAVLLLYWPK